MEMLFAACAFHYAFPISEFTGTSPRRTLVMSYIKNRNIRTFHIPPLIKTQGIENTNSNVINVTNKRSIHGSGSESDVCVSPISSDLNLLRKSKSKGTIPIISIEKKKNESSPNNKHDSLMKKEHLDPESLQKTLFNIEQDIEGIVSVFIDNLIFV